MAVGESQAGSPFVVTSAPAPGVLQLTLSRPERRNALSSSAMKELLAALVAADENPEIGCVMLAAEGPVFSAGHDLKELAGYQDTQGGYQDAHGRSADARASCQVVFDLCARLMTQLVRSGTPSIAVVHGLATAAGCQLVASCDLAVASEHAAFATPGVDIGLFCATPSVALSRNVSRKAAMEMLLLGQRVPASRALELGLVNRVVGEEEADSVALQMAVAIASKPRATVAAGKANFYRQIEKDLEGAYAEMSKAMAEGLMAGDAGEGIGAFVEKRKPRWNVG